MTNHSKMITTRRRKQKAAKKVKQAQRDAGKAPAKKPAK
jgi:hypothetical protein